VQFEWDPTKAEANIRNHGVSFSLAASVFLDPLAWTFPDPHHSYGELRFITVGEALDGQLLVVSHVEDDGETIRIISARAATTRERQDYEDA
jgi:uncharacterized DUF497 family protein